MCSVPTTNQRKWVISYKFTMCADCIRSSLFTPSQSFLVLIKDLSFMKDDCYSFYQLWYNLRNIFSVSSNTLTICCISHYSVTSFLCLVGKGGQLKQILILFSLRGFHISCSCTPNKNALF